MWNLIAMSHLSLVEVNVLLFVMHTYKHTLFFRKGLFRIKVQLK